MEPLTNKPTDQELIEKCEVIIQKFGGLSIIPGGGETYPMLCELLTRFKTLTENNTNRKFLAGFITEIKNEFPDDNWDYLDFIADRFIADFYTRPQSAKTGVEEIIQAIKKETLIGIPGRAMVIYENDLRTALTKLLEK